MKNKLAFLSIVLLVLMISSCDKSNNKQEYIFPEFSANQSTFSEIEILNAAYTDYKYPNNFYYEDLGDTNLYYINTVSNDSLPFDPRIELSTLSKEQAYQWTINSSEPSSIFIDGKESEKFFEFIETNNPNEHLKLKFRTHRADYLTRDEYNGATNPNQYGIFTKESFTPEEAKELIDYLWFIRSYKLYGSKILSSFYVDGNENIDIIHYGIAVNYGDFNINDVISFYKHTYHINKTSGVIILEQELLAEIVGEEN